MDSATEFLFGNCAHALSRPLSLPGGQRVQNTNAAMAGVAKFSDSFQKLVNTIGERVKSNWPWQLNEIFRNPIRQEMKVVNDYCKPIIDRAVEQAKMRKARRRADAGLKGEDLEGENLLTYLASQTDGERALQSNILELCT